MKTYLTSDRHDGDPDQAVGLVESYDAFLWISGHMDIITGDGLAWGGMPASDLSPTRNDILLVANAQRVRLPGNHDAGMMSECKPMHEHVLGYLPSLVTDVPGAYRHVADDGFVTVAHHGHFEALWTKRQKLANEILGHAYRAEGKYRMIDEWVMKPLHWAENRIIPPGWRSTDDEHIKRCVAWVMANFPDADLLDTAHTHRLGVWQIPIPDRKPLWIVNTGAAVPSHNAYDAHGLDLHVAEGEVCMGAYCVEERALYRWTENGMVELWRVR